MGFSLRRINGVANHANTVTVRRTRRFRRVIGAADVGMAARRLRAPYHAAMAPIADTRWHALRISPKTTWCFVELVDRDGLVGIGEATLTGREALVHDAFARLSAALAGTDAGKLDGSVARNAATTLPEFAAISALDQAARDLAARQRNASVAATLGAIVRESIPVYANINRGTLDRTPAGFAARARDAVADGFAAIKIAPFDEVSLRGDATLAIDDAALGAGLARIVAVREAVGPAIDLMVDCHWRLNRAAAHRVLAELDACKLYWLECPVPETAEMLDTLRALRADANARGVRLAGCEEMRRVDGFMPFIEAGAYDVMMPDAKYVGGLDEMLAVAAALAHHGMAFSPHNPSGPVCHAASVQVCAVAATLDRLEMQYAESPLFDAIVGGHAPRAVNGAIALPRGPGLGVTLDERLARALASD
jgi:galactonate dehydratase